MKDRKNVLFVNGNLSVGGVEKSLINLLNAIDKERFSVDLFLYQKGRELEDELAKDINVITYDISRSFGPIQEVVKKALRYRKWADLWLRICWKMPRIFGQKLMRGLSKQYGIDKKYDIAIAYRSGPAEEIVLGTVKSEKKITWWHHGEISAQFDIKRLRYNWSKFNRIIAVSDGIADLLKQELPDVKDKIEVIYNTVDFSSVISKSTQFKPFIRTDSIFRLVTVGRLSPEKNILRVVDIAVELKKRNIDFIWAIVGDGPLMTSIKDRIIDYSLDDKFILVGQTDKPYPWIADADIMVHPSLCESFGLVLVEAMILETPCIAGKSLGANDIIDGNNGLLVDDIPEAYLSAIETIVNSDAKRSQIIKSGCVTAKRFSKGHVVDSLVKIIEDE